MKIVPPVRSSATFCSLLLIAASLHGCALVAAAPDWPVYLGEAGAHYSTLCGIDRTNVARLQPAWTFRTGDAGSNTQIQCNPVIVDGVLYGTSAQLKLFALDAATGKERWRFDPFAGATPSPDINDSTRKTEPTGDASVSEIPYATTGYNRFLDPDGYPAVRPPWGTLNAIDLNTGEYLWRRPLGELPELTAAGLPPTGTENYGGPLVTAGGLIFIGATKDEKFRAFDKTNGELLWEAALPAGGYAVPATYSIAGRQFVVIACGGGKMGTKSGDAYVAYALPSSP